VKRFKSTGSKQIFLLPPSLDELVPKDSLARLVSEIVEMLDLELLYQRYCHDGRPAYHPKMLVKILFYAYSNGITSSRKIAQRLEQDTHFLIFVQLAISEKTILICLVNFLNRLF
jgi:transposase